MTRTKQYDFSIPPARVRARDQHIVAVTDDHTESDHYRDHHPSHGSHDPSGSHVPDLYQKVQVAIKTLEILLDRDWLTDDTRVHLQAELDELLIDLSQRQE